MASFSRSTAAARAAAPSSAHDSPPKAIMLVPTAALANVTSHPAQVCRPPRRRPATRTR